MKPKILDLSSVPNENITAILKQLEGYDVFVGYDYIKAFGPDGKEADPIYMASIAGIIRVKNPPGQYLATAKTDNEKVSYPVDENRADAFLQDAELNIVVKNIQRDRYGMTSDDEAIQSLMSGDILAKRSSQQ